MSKIIDGLLYSREDEWIKVDGDEGVVGITDYAQDALSDIVFLELPDVGARYEAGEEFGVVESVKAAADLFMPVAGEILAVNEPLLDTPEMVNTDPYGEAWMVRIKFSDLNSLDGLMDAAAYRAYCEERG